MDIVDELRELADEFASIGHDVDMLREAANEIDRLRADAARLDWLADPANRVGNVQLPTECVLAHPESMRAAIDMAMRMEVTP